MAYSLSVLQEREMRWHVMWNEYLLNICRRSEDMQLCTSFWRKLIELSPSHVRPFRQNQFARSLHTQFFLCAIDGTISCMSRCLSAYHFVVLHSCAMCCQSITLDFAYMAIWRCSCDCDVRESLIHFPVGCLHEMESTTMPLASASAPIRGFIEIKKCKNECSACSIDRVGTIERESLYGERWMERKNVCVWVRWQREVTPIIPIFFRPFLASCRRFSLMNATYHLICFYWKFHFFRIVSLLCNNFGCFFSSLVSFRFDFFFRFVFFFMN